MSKPKKSTVTLQEQRYAVEFLRYVGGNWHSTDLMLAVVAWLRVSMRRAMHGINNPFNIHPSALDAAYRSGMTLDKNGRRISKFASMDKALQAMAHILRVGGTAGDHGFAAIVAATKNDSGSDFILALSETSENGVLTMSTVDASGKGYGFVITDPTTGKWTSDIQKERESFKLIANPPTLTTTTKKQPPPKRPVVPKNLSQLIIRPQYIGGFEAETFYRARHPRGAALDSGQQ